MQMQKLRSLCWEHRAVKVFPLKPGVGQNTAMHASPAAWNLLLVKCCWVMMHVYKFMPLAGLWVEYKWGEDTSIKENRSRLFEQSCSDTGRRVQPFSVRQRHLFPDK